MEDGMEREGFKIGEEVSFLFCGERITGFIRSFTTRPCRYPFTVISRGTAFALRAEHMEHVRAERAEAATQPN
jgi:hypothetical protein